VQQVYRGSASDRRSRSRRAGRASRPARSRRPARRARRRSGRWRARRSSRGPGRGARSRCGVRGLAMGDGQLPADGVGELQPGHLARSRAALASPAKPSTVTSSMTSWFGLARARRGGRRWLRARPARHRWSRAVPSARRTRIGRSRHRCRRPALHGQGFANRFAANQHSRRAASWISTGCDSGAAGVDASSIGIDTAEGVEVRAQGLDGLELADLGGSISRRRHRILGALTYRPALVLAHWPGLDVFTDDDLDRLDRVAAFSTRAGGLVGATGGPDRLLARPRS